MTNYLSGEDILAIHSELIEQTGGSHGLRDQPLFLSLIEKPSARFGGADLYLGVFAKAAIYLESLVNYHVFIDGNKRTGLVATARFLFLNDYDLIAKNKELEKFVLRVAKEKLNHSVIVQWLEAHSRPI